MAPRFDSYVIVDWSASNQPKSGRDSIWICRRDRDGERIENPPTRHRAREVIAEMLAVGTARGERMVLGFDFPFGYPQGFAERLGLTGTPWRAVWDEIAGLIEDDEQNRSNRFVVGAELNRRLSGGRFPFWGCPAGFDHEFLGPKHHNGHAGSGLAEKRLIDEWMVGAQPCWKLAYTGSVGSQVLTGIPVVRALRDDPRWAAEARVWPCETGLGLPDAARIVFAEVWPSWWRKLVRPELGPPADRAQVRTVAGVFAEHDAAGDLEPWFAPPVGTGETARIVAEEAWTLGVMTARRSADSAVRSTRKSIYLYLRDPAAITRRSFALVRAEAELGRFPPAMRPVALRIGHAAGDVSILAEFAWSEGAVAAGTRALAAGAPILVDSAMVQAGIAVDRLPARNPIVCTLSDPSVPALAARLGTTRSAAAVELWRAHLDGAVVAIGNAPTALFHLLEIVASGAGRPALVLGFPVGFVGAAESKAALAEFGGGLAFITLHGRRGGSALAAAAVNALCRARR
jgi:precorrin-8X/cobalt-precorrin-8 methylmutase